MYNSNILYGVSGHVAEITGPNKAVIHFEVNEVLQSAFLKSERFYKDGKRLRNNENLNEVIKVGYQVNFSCHLNKMSDPGQCKWFVISCWHQIESEQKVIMLSGMMNVAGTVTHLKQRHGTLLMYLMGTEHRVHFLASRLYLYGKRISASKPLTNYLQIDDKLYFDAIPCFAEENHQNCDWFATCVYKGKKPILSFYKNTCETDPADVDREKMLNQYVESIRSDNASAREDSPLTHTDIVVDGLNNDIDNLDLTAEFSPTRSNCQDPFPEYESTTSFRDTVSDQSKALTDDEKTSEVSNITEPESTREHFYSKVEPNRLNAQMSNDLKLLTNDPRVVFAKSEGIILDIINEEYGVILGEFRRNVFQSILFHRKNAFLFKMSLADSKLTEIFIEGDRVKFIAVYAPEKFICDLVATQVSVAYDKDDEDDDLDGDSSED